MLACVRRADWGPMPAILVEDRVVNNSIRIRDPLSQREFTVGTGDIMHIVDPGGCAVLPFFRPMAYGDFCRASRGEARYAANDAQETLLEVERKRRPKRRVELSDVFRRLKPMRIRKMPLYDDSMSGYWHNHEYILAHRNGNLDARSFLACMLFAMVTANRPVVAAEKGYWSLRDAILENRWPDRDTLIRILTGSMGRKSAPEQLAEYVDRWIRDGKFREWHHGVAEGYMYCLTQWCMRDAMLRREVSTKIGTLPGLGMIKFSFGLMLLGQDMVCLDTHVLNWLLGWDQAKVKALKNWGFPKSPGKDTVTPLTISRYEKLENALLSNTDFYTPGELLGKTKAHWMTWEALYGGEVMVSHLSLALTLASIHKGTPPPDPGDKTSDLATYLHDLEVRPVRHASVQNIYKYIRRFSERPTEQSSLL